MKKGKFKREIKKIKKLIKMGRITDAKILLDKIRETELNCTVVKIETIIWTKMVDRN